MGRKIPATMATQHPDNAGAPAWLQHASAFIDTRHEVEECYRSFADLRCGEYMWDWEGKHVDEAVVERLLEKQGHFFRRKQLGRDVFLTYRVPNVWVERGYRIARAFASIVSANDFVREAHLHQPPVFECILPFTARGEQAFLVRKQYAAIARAFGGADIARAFSLEKAGPEDIRVIPLIEQPEHLLEADKILGEYAAACRKNGFECSEMRAFIARSDPALNNGLVPATVAARAALAKCADFEEKSGVEVHPIVGVGCLPFRGGLSPENAGEFLKHHAGVSTVTIQSAFRYDYEEGKVKAAIAQINAHRGKKAAPLSDYGKIKSLLGIFTKNYQKTIAGIAADVNKAAAFVPQRRERKLHVGVFGYARRVGKTAMPRAIAFTSAMYSLGVPPELIGTGRGMKEARQKGVGSCLDEFEPLLREYVAVAGGFLNRENLSVLAASGKAWRAVEEDVRILEEWLGEKMTPVDETHFIHRNLTSNILMLFRRGGNPSEDVVRAAEIRKSLG